MIPPFTPVSVILDDPAGRALIDKLLPGLTDSPHLDAVRRLPVDELLASPQLGLTDETRAMVWAELHALADAGLFAPPLDDEVVEPDVNFEDESVPVGSAELVVPASGRRWAPVEVELRGPSHGNPFVDVELSAEFTCGEVATRVGGFYDGDGVYRIRFLPPTEGTWEFTTSSTARSLHAVTGSIDIDPAADGIHGPVAADGFHFAHADGTRFAPVGTTAYAWTHQTEALQEQTLRTLAASPFTKLRMCVFPKSYDYNDNEPELFPFEGSKQQGWDTTRFLPAFFQHLERRIAQLGELGIEADLILFHPYDSWGFSRLGRAADDRYVRYLVRRLAALPNVWWSLANEYDLVRAKDEADWERFAGIIVDEDHVGHLRSIHNFQDFYDHGRAWVTHCSVQRHDLDQTTQWRERWGKPVVVDECGYEGNIDHGWGNLTGQELVRRAWEGTVRGGYVVHGETYLNDREELWWSKGGELVGSSPDRLAFLARFVAESPTGALEPVGLGSLASGVPWGGVEGNYYLGYFGLTQPSFCRIDLPPGDTFKLEIIDTWEMTVEAIPGTFSGTTRIPLPARAYTAARLVRVDA